MLVRCFFFSTLLWPSLIGSAPIRPAIAQSLPAPACAAPALARLTPHTSAAGETLAAIAAQHRLTLATVQHFNPRLPQGTLPAGTTVLIPPYNGIQITVPLGSTWNDLAKDYQVRADVLFEVNGCRRDPEAVAFIPRSTQRPTVLPSAAGDRYEGLTHSPLAIALTRGLAYGWYEREAQAQSFHSGLDLLAPVGTTVQAAATGTIAFVGPEGDYGQLVVINHAGGRQTRYAHLSSITVNMGQAVEAGQAIGTVGTSGRPDISPSHLHFEVRQQAPVGWIAQDPALHLQVEVR
ncbi:MAG: LysM peptidoglycan-binding domain-containing M23 family metallopeptidase [Spirulinaceae cyanobacterium]